MELVQDAHGNPAPRLGDLEFEASEAEEIYQQLIREVVRMLCAGVVHGDLSDFNVLMSASGPVVIDFPQSVDPAHNRNARKLLLRDVENLHRFVSNFSSRKSTRPYAEEMWELYESNQLAPDTELTGSYRVSDAIADTEGVLALIDEANREERERRAAHIEDVDIDPTSDSTGGPVPKPKFKPRRAVVDFSAEIQPRRVGDTRRKKTGKAPARQPAKRTAPAKVPGEAGAAAPKKRRARRTRKTGNQSSGGGEKPTTSKKTARARPRRNVSPSKANADKREVAPRESDAGKGRRRRSRGRGRSRTEDDVTGAKAGAGSGKARADANTKGRPRAATTAGNPSGTTARTSPSTPPSTSGAANRPAKLAAGQTARRGQGNREATKGSDAPRRRRRRRPRAEES
jgi:RIO kinase 1